MAQGLEGEDMSAIGRFENTMRGLKVQTEGLRVGSDLDIALSTARLLLKEVAPRGSAVMSMRFSDADPIIDCHTDGCRQHFHGDAAVDAWRSWYAHLRTAHPGWGE